MQKHTHRHGLQSPDQLKENLDEKKSYPGPHHVRTSKDCPRCTTACHKEDAKIAFQADSANNTCRPEVAKNRTSKKTYRPEGATEILPRRCKQTCQSKGGTIARQPESGKMTAGWKVQQKAYQSEDEELACQPERGNKNLPDRRCNNKPVKQTAREQPASQKV